MAYSVATLKAKRKNAKAKRKTFINRQSAVKKAYDNSYRLDDYYSKIKHKTDASAEDLRNGMTGIDGISSKCNGIRNSDEGQALSNSFPFYNAISDIKSEYNRCGNEISSLDYKIKTYERQIREQGGVILPWE